jgi:hypothetical protein
MVSALPENPKVKVCVRGVDNLPLIVNPTNGKTEQCEAYARLNIGNANTKTAVVPGASSVRWDHDWTVHSGGDDDDEVKIELLHCNQLGLDTYLGSTVANVSEILKHAPVDRQDGARVVEKILPLLNRDGKLLLGQDDTRATFFTLDFVLFDADSSQPFHNDEDISLPTISAPSLVVSRAYDPASATAAVALDAPEKPVHDAKALSQPLSGVGPHLKVSPSNDES